MTELTPSKPKGRNARESKVAEDAQVASPPATDSKPSKKPAAQTKMGKVVALLVTGEGAALNQMVEATGRLPHTARTALTELKKKGYTSSAANGMARVSIASPRARHEKAARWPTDGTRHDGCC